MVQNADNSLVRNNLHSNAGINTVFSIEALSLFTSVFLPVFRYFFLYVFVWICSCYY